MLSIAQAAKSLPNKPSPGTVWRWITKGIKGGIKLESTYIGERIYTSVEALDRFHKQNNERNVHQTIVRETPTQRKRRVERLNRKLAAEGI